MKIVIAPDSMKGSLDADAGSECIEKGILKVFNSAEVIKMPMADGGEGTVKALVKATNGKLIEAEAHDPLMRKIPAFYGVLGDGTTAIVEVAAASGIELLKKEERNPLLATSFGTGELIRDALDRGCRKFIIGLGGSATNDGGAGILCALGAEIFDSGEKSVPFGGAGLNNADKIVFDNLDPRLLESSFIVACDVNNPLTGPNGASSVFGPQKGATPEMVKLLDESLANYARLLNKVKDQNIALIPGTGAAGGMAASLLTFFNTELKPGFTLISEISGLERHIKEADFVVTAEGKTEHQTLAGKVPMGVALLGKKYNIPVFILTGYIGEGTLPLYEKGTSAIVPIEDKPLTLEEAMHNAPLLMEDTAERLCRILKAGMQLKGKISQ